MPNQRLETQTMLKSIPCLVTALEFEVRSSASKRKASVARQWISLLRALYLPNQGCKFAKFVNIKVTDRFQGSALTMENKLNSKPWQLTAELEHFHSDAVCGWTNRADQDVTLIVTPPFHQSFAHFLPTGLVTYLLCYSTSALSEEKALQDTSWHGLRYRQLHLRDLSERCKESRDRTKCQFRRGAEKWLRRYLYDMANECKKNGCNTLLQGLGDTALESGFGAEKRNRGKQKKT